MANLSCFFHISIIDFLVHILFQVQLYTHKTKSGRYIRNIVFLVVAVDFRVHYRRLALQRNRAMYIAAFIFGHDLDSYFLRTLENAA